MYTSNAVISDNLNASSVRVGTLASDLGQELRRLESATAIEDSRFVISSNRLCQGCQNGGTQEFWLVDTRKPRSVSLLCELPGPGGGRFVTFAVGPRWLFWSMADTNPIPPLQTALLLDTRTGTRQVVDLGATITVEQARWASDGRLHVVLDSAHAERIIDPATGHAP